MSFETLVDILAVIGALSVVWQAMKLVARFLGWVERSEIERQRKEAQEQARTPESVPAEHVAAIAAAVAAFDDGVRVVHIEDSASGHAWTHEGRWLHQTSHQQPRHSY